MGESTYVESSGRVVVDTTRAVGGRCVKYIAPATAASATSTPKAMRVRFDMECPF